MTQPLLEMREIQKAFPGVLALDHARLDVAAGECHALIGENGAGKSTLVKILAGALEPDAGEIHIAGRRVRITSPLDARRLGVSIIYQELNLLPELTVAENVFLGREPTRAGLFLARRAMRDESRRWLERLGAAIDPRRRVGDLPLAGQQMVEIAKALALEARILVMDEPSAILTDRELDELFRLVAKLRGEGLAIVYISHRLEEIDRICDRVTVMRDGKTIATHAVGSVSRSELVREMVGRELTRGFPERPDAQDEIVLEARGIVRRPMLGGVSLSLRRGEIVGLAGLVGSGRTEIARVLFGADPLDDGEIVFEGQRLAAHSPHEAIARGIGLLTEDRKGQGLVLSMEVGENITLPALERLARRGILRRAREREHIAPLVERLRIRTPSLREPIAQLSGGNQQKSVLARWLFTRSRLLIFDEPTRGIDVGAKAEIYQLIMDLAREGKSILVISSELPELLGLCHRIYVMRAGAVAAELAARDATQEAILAAAMGVR